MFYVCRIVQIILEQNHNNERPVLEKIVRVYAPYWFAIARCPPLTFRILDMSRRKTTRRIGVPFQSKRNNEVILQEISKEEINEGHTIASALNFKLLGLSASISQSSEEHFGPVTDLSPLGDMVIAFVVYVVNCCFFLFAKKVSVFLLTF